jgi:hypothetical protein
MGFQYENRRGEIYYLLEGKTSTGKPKYSMSRKPSGKQVEALPVGYEIYEAPEHGQVHARQIKLSAITPSERQTVADAMRRYSAIEQAIVDVEEDSLVVWTPSMGVSEAETLIHDLAGSVSTSRARELRESVLKRSRYEKMLRFLLVNPDRRLFAVQRWCFRGSIDDWIRVGGPGPLADLAKEYAKHLGRESFFELM